MPMLVAKPFDIEVAKVAAYWCGSRGEEGR
jgi:hypothetical protein